MWRVLVTGDSTVDASITCLERKRYAYSIQHINDSKELGMPFI
jgi:hypothetical protein